MPKAFLQANPEMAARIEQAIRENSGLIADRIFERYGSEGCRRRMIPKGVTRQQKIRNLSRSIR